MLITLWLVSLAIAGVALAIMIGLIVARWLTGWRRRARERERRRLIPLLLGETDPRDIGAGIWRAADLVVELTVELIQLVRGSERERFIARATALGVPARLRHHLGSGHARMRQMAAEALAYFPDDMSIERLQAALGDRNPDVRLTAALSLAQSGHSPPAVELVRRLGIGERERSLLVTSLFKDVASQRPGELEALLTEADMPSAARVAAVEALAHAGRYEAVPLIAAIINEDRADERDLPRFLRALGQLGHPAGADAVRRGLASRSAHARGAAAEAAGRIGLVELAPRLVELLEDPVWRVRFRAGEALARLGEPGQALLRSAAEHGPGPRAAAAALILAEQAA